MHLLKKILACTISCFCTIITMAQCSIAGKVNDSTGTALPYAATGLLKAKDSALVTGVLTNDSGIYVFDKIKPGSYLIKVQITGYATYISKPITAGNGKTIIPPIQLKDNGNNLQRVSVKADKPFMQRDAGKTIFNVENSIIATGKNVLELLNELPGVSADENGGIRVLNKTGVLVLVNGKPINVDIANFLKGIDASQIEKIEVISNPSAKYQASGNAVINIVLKRDKNMGLNGELYASAVQKYYLSSQESQNINYRTKKWGFSLVSSENFFHRYFNHTLTKTLTPNNGTPELFDENAPWIIHGSYSFGTIGIDYMPDKKQTFSFSSDFELQFEKLNTYDNTIMHTPYSVADSSLYAENTRDYTALHAMPYLSYKYKPDSSEQELDIQLLLNAFQQNDKQQNFISYYTATGQESRPSTQFNSIQGLYMNIGALQADYIQPLTKNIKLDAGIYEQYGEPVNNAQFWNVVNSTQLIDSTKTNRFDFTENILAGYVTYQQKINKKLDYQLGLRAEQTYNKGLQQVHDTSFTRNYTNIFPSASFDWKPSNMHSFSLSYTRRIDRPYYGDMNPFITEIDPYSYIVGNVFLLPDISDHFELDYTFKQFLTLTLAHDYYGNVFKEVYYKNDTSLVTYYKQENVGYYLGYNAMITVSVPVFKWWTTITSVNLYHDDYHDVAVDNNLDITNNSINFKTLNTFTWKHNLNAEASFEYNSSDLQGVTITQPVYALEAGMGKRLFNDRLIIKVSCADILRSTGTKASTVYGGLSIVEYNYYDQQTFTIGLTWKFGKSQYNRQNTAKENLLLKGAK